MLKSYIKIAFRSILKNKLYAAINILGLTLGLVFYLFGGLLATYENSHDQFFENSARVYTIRGNINAESNIGVKQLDNVFSAVAPQIKSNLSEVDAVARTILREFLISVEENNYYEKVRFADPELLEIFDFDFLEGDSSAFAGSNGIIITETIANKYFGNKNPIGETLTLDHENDLTVMAVISDIPQNSHFNSQIVMSMPIGVLIPMVAMERITKFQPDTDWGNSSMGNLTYVMLPETLDREWLQDQMDGIYERFVPDTGRFTPKSFLTGFDVRVLSEANTAIWDVIGIPVISIVEGLGGIVLLIACVNYTNLATAQFMGRAREVGLRKTLGAGQMQLLLQFIIESLTITFFSMLLALVVLEILIPIFNSATGKIIFINYLYTLPWLVLTTVLVGVFSGAYPSYLITKTNPIEALRDVARKGRSAGLIRAVMIGIQFTFSVSILTIVLVVFAQNEKVEESSRIFPKDQIYILDRINVEQMEGRHEVLRNQILNIAYVEDFTLSSQVPYEQNNRSFQASTVLNDIASGISINQLNIDERFIEVYNIPLIAGRKITRKVAMDTHIRENGAVNVMVNELAAKQLGFASSEAAIGQFFYEDEGDKGITTYTIVGVMEDRNILGLFASVKPFVFFMRAASYRLASIKISSNAPISIVQEIEEAWQEVYWDYPMQGKFLDETFQMVYLIFDMGSKSLATFSFIALIIASFGLFGLAAFMAKQKTKEIGIRKVLGASNNQIIQLLIWQFLTPVLWATPLALGIGYFASQTYLNFFAERIGMPYGMLILAGLFGLILSCITVSVHAFRVSKINPIKVLSHE